MPHELETYWTTKEVAARLKKSEVCVKRWLKLGLLERTKAANSTLITESSLQRFLKNSTEKAA